MVLEIVAGLGRTLFKLFQHPSLAIVKAAGLIMKSIIEEGDQETATKMQELALYEGALPRHLHTALFTASVDNRLLTHRQLSRHLITLWITGNPTATALLHRILVSSKRALWNNVIENTCIYTLLTCINNVYKCKYVRTYVYMYHKVGGSAFSICTCHCMCFLSVAPRPDAVFGFRWRGTLYIV